MDRDLTIDAEMTTEAEPEVIRDEAGDPFLVVPLTETGAAVIEADNDIDESEQVLMIADEPATDGE